MAKERIRPEKFPVYITITKGSNKKYKFDTQTGILQLVEVLYAAVCYPVVGIKIQKKRLKIIPILDNTNSMGFVETESILKFVYEELQYFYNTYNGAVDVELRTSGNLSGIHADRGEKDMKNYAQEHGEY